MSVVVGPKPEDGSSTLCDEGGRLDARSLDPHHGDVCRLGSGPAFRVRARVILRVRVSV